MSTSTFSPTIHVAIPGTVLKSTALFALDAKNAARTGKGSYLQQVCITSIRGTLYVVATDGNAMACFESNRQTVPDFEILMPAPTINAFKTSKANAEADWLFHIHPAVRDPQTTHVTEPAQDLVELPAGVSQSFEASTDKYPPFLRVIPPAEPEPMAPTYFDHRLLAKFVAAQKILGVSDKLHGVLDYLPQGNRGIRVGILVDPPMYWEFIGVVMPFKLGDTTGY
mgnify:CR=1 FL=1